MINLISWLKVRVQGPSSVLSKHLLNGWKESLAQWLECQHFHAICDALLGAAALGDIGKHFPDNDPKYKNIDSKLLLRHCNELLLENGYRVGNIDSIIVAQKPKVGPYIPQMRECIASILGIEPGQVSVKATTTEHLGFEGREEGISAHAIALLLPT